MTYQRTINRSKRKGSEGGEKTQGARGRGSNPRLKSNRWEMKDSELNEEIKSGAVLVSLFL